MKNVSRVVVILWLAFLSWAASTSVLAHEPLDRQLERINRLVAERPADAELLLRRGELHRVRKHWQAAQADYDRARELDPELDLVDFCSGRMRLEAGEPARALAHLEAYLERRPEDAAGLELRGRARAGIGLIAEAVADYNRAIERFLESGGRASPDLFLRRSRALAQTGSEHFHEAIRGLDEGIALLGEPVVLHLEALELEEKTGRIDEALRRLDRIASRADRQEVWLARRGEILARAGRDKEALDAYRKALAILEKTQGGRARPGALERLETRLREVISDLEGQEVRP